MQKVALYTAATLFTVRGAVAAIFYVLATHLLGHKVDIRVIQLLVVWSPPVPGFTLPSKAKLSIPRPMSGSLSKTGHILASPSIRAHAACHRRSGQAVHQP